jgi:hypothetical protein
MNSTDAPNAPARPAITDPDAPHCAPSLFSHPTCNDFHPATVTPDIALASESTDPTDTAHVSTSAKAVDGSAQLSSLPEPATSTAQDVRNGVSR